MDQMQQEILHSLFSSFSSSPTESRGSLYPYNYHFGQYSHSNTTRAGIPPVSHGLPSPQSRYHLGMMSPGLIAGAHNFTSYGIHNARLPGGDRMQESESGSRQSHSTTRIQHGTADLRTDFRSNTRHSLSSSADQHYLVDHLRASSTQQRPSHKSSYSVQPQDLRSHVIDTRIFEDPRAMLESRTTKERNHRSNKEEFNGKRTTAKSRYPGNINTGRVPNTPSVSTGIHTPRDSEALPIKKNSGGSHLSSQVRPDEKMSSKELKLVIRRKHCQSSDQGTNKLSVCDRKALAAETNLIATLEQQNINKTENKGYQVVQNSETHTSHSSHTLNQNVNVRKLQEGTENCKVNFDNKPLSLINNTHVSGNNNIFYNEEEDSSEDDSEEDEGLVEEDFDSEASSTGTELSNIAHDVLNRSMSSYKPYTCQDCEATFTTKGNLKVHQRIHTGERPYRCEECGKTFSYCGAYQSHMMIHTGQRLFTCEFCQREFVHGDHLERHIRRHTGEKPFKCTECDATFAASNSLACHTRTHTGERSYTCELCDKAFTHYSSFRRHEQMHMEEIYKCDECGTGFRNAHKLERHMKKHNDPNYIPGSECEKSQLDKKVKECKFCHIKFDNREDYHCHKLTHISEDPYTCDMCKVTFHRRKNLIIHLRTHTGEKPYKCEFCNLAFAQKSNMNAHMRIHSGDKPLKCDQCGASFLRNHSLIIHKRTHTGEKPYVCDHCDAAFAQKPHLNLHQQSHTGIKPYTCDECSMTFTKKVYLLTHKTKHDESKDNALVQNDDVYRCNHCEKMFTNLSSLAVHTRKHTGERPYVCEECGASFLYSSNLTTHRRKHTGECQHKCTYCASSFTLKSYLTMHLRKHTGEKPFQCDICQARFTQKTSLSTHKRIHTGECPYTCEECGEAFHDRGNFWRHKKKHTIGEGAATIKRRRNKKGLKQGGGKVGGIKGKGVSKGRGKDGSTVTGQGNDTAVPTRRSARVPKPRIEIKELFEPLPDWLEAAMKQEPQSEAISEQKEDNSSRNREQETNEGEEREQMCMFLEPEVRIKLEDESWGMEMREEEEERMVASS
ncbi:hypothetical protein Pcinc_025123 [Petrolisthes cinctipes]|uniref:C2H2-type domain-containing protein n=1 Tax=Petrolisthes cinctipes TaxID=88211 RepID=A0AAE1F9S8_PETCI|nr:hypothetical protein Pcinc_036669 [Petrolisthes cinctipes]KAK3869569.1 hypothetical protein Pcinc_025123 [Petrolisthes cinctipes]